MAELPARNGNEVLPAGGTRSQILAFFVDNGYRGHYLSTANGVEAQGSLADFGAAALALRQAHCELVRGPQEYSAAPTK